MAAPRNSQPTEASRPPGRVLIPKAKIAARVKALGREVTKHYRGDRPLLLGIMNGALFFLTDLLRAVDLDTEISCLRLSSYRGTASTGRLRGLDVSARTFRGRRVLVVDDILDTGLTLSQIVAQLKRLGAVEVKVCVLLEKRRERVRPIDVDWVGFSIADEFVVGYGLDCDGLYRGLKDIRVLKA
jgi:hypoxanthine phosphoribosyltransferase